MGFQIAIDGPVGSGKSTVSRELSQKLGFVYIDTGAMYRAVGLYMLRHGVAPSDGAGVAAALPAVGIEIQYRDGAQHIFLNGEDVSEPIRMPAASHAASQVAAHARVREKLVKMQAGLASEHDIVMDGRDIGTVVLPGANLKIYLDARPEIRARRRFEELAPGNPGLRYEQVLADTIERDRFDMNREHSPLRKAEDAVLIDVSELSLSGVVHEIEELARRKRDALQD